MTENLFNEEPTKLEQWQVDKYIEIVKENNATIDKYKDILKNRIADLERQFKVKEEKLLKENHYLLTTLGEFAKEQDDLRSTKTQFVWDGLSGDVIIRKSLPQTKRPPAKKIDDVEKVYPDLVTTEEVKKLNWRDLKSKIIVQNGVPYDKETGEDLSRFVEVEMSNEEVRVR